MYIEAVEVLETFGEAAGRPIGIGNPSENQKKENEILEKLLCSETSPTCF